MPFTTTPDSVLAVAVTPPSPSPLVPKPARPDSNLSFAAPQPLRVATKRATAPATRAVMRKERRM
jgi:hypothetical protein